MRYIYITTNKTNGKRYLGQRKIPKNKTHENDSYLGSGNVLLKAIRKHGRHNFSKEIIHLCNTQEEADRLEISEIEKRGVLNDRENWYNLDAGGQYGRSEKHSVLTSEAMKEYYNDDDNYNKSIEKLNNTRINKGLSPLKWTTAKEKRDYKIANRRKSNKRKAKLALSRLNNKAKNKLKTKAKKPHSILAVSKATWKDKDKTMKRIMEGRAKRKIDRESKGENYYKNDTIRLLSIAKLKANNNYTGLYLMGLGMINIKSLYPTIKRLNTMEYVKKDNYYNQIKSIIDKVTELGYDVNAEKLINAIENTRRHNDSNIYPL